MTGRGNERRAEGVIVYIQSLIIGDIVRNRSTKFGTTHLHEWRIEKKEIP